IPNVLTSALETGIPLPHVAPGFTIDGAGRNPTTAPSATHNQVHIDIEVSLAGDSILSRGISQDAISNRMEEARIPQLSASEIASGKHEEQEDWFDLFVNLN